MVCQLSPVTQLRMQRMVAHLHSLGPRVVHELLVEVVAAHGLEADILDRLERFSRLDPNTLGAFGGDRFPARPLTPVQP